MPPEFIQEHILEPLQGHYRRENRQASVVEAGLFKAYSLIKSTIRHDPSILTATKGHTTAALSVPGYLIKGPLKKKHEKLIGLARGVKSDETDTSTKPMKREQAQLRASVKNNHVGYRMEQRFTIDMDNITPARKSCAYVLQAAQEFVHFFTSSIDKYCHYLRRFPVDVRLDL